MIVKLLTEHHLAFLSLKGTADATLLEISCHISFVIERGGGGAIIQT